MISVIVPVFNVQKYLRRCVDSILAQTYTDFELLLIDDGSQDECPQICDAYARQDKRVRTFHKQNGGVSDARNYGLERIKGDYVSFVDSDDYIGPDCLKILMQLIEEYHVRISVIACWRSKEEGVSFVQSEDARGLIPNHEIIKSMTQFRIIFSAWGKLMHKSLLSQVTFPKGYYFEDNLTIPYIMCERDAVAYSTSKQYCWFAREDSITRTVVEKKYYDWEIGIDKLLDYTKQKYARDVEYVEGWIATSIWHIAIDQMLFSDNYQQYARHAWEKYGPILKKAWSLPVITQGRKLKASIFMLSPSLYESLRKGWSAIKKRQGSGYFFYTHEGEQSKRGSC